MAVGNSAVVNTALALAEAELDAKADYIGLQESHGLLLLSAIKKLGIDWRQQVDRNRQLNRLVERLEHDMIHLGVLPIVLHHLGWDDDENDRYDYWQLDEERVARRLRAFDLLLDPAKATVLTALSKIAFGEQAPAGRKQQGYIVALAGGDYNRFVNAEVENLLINYLGISKV